MNKKRILITGGTGFIGAALVKRLIEVGNNVRVLDNNSRGSVKRLKSVIDNIELVTADIRDIEKVKEAARNMDAIVHLAAINGTGFFYTIPKLVLDVGIRGMLNVLDASVSEGVHELFVASSSEVYQTPTIVPTDENVLVSIPNIFNPRYSYAGEKIVSELLAINYGRTDFSRVVIFRPHNVYGPDMGWEHVLPQFILRAKENIEKYKTGLVPFSIQGNGDQTRSFIHIDDFVSGLMYVLEKGQHLNIYNIGTQEEIQIKDVAKKIVNHLGREPELIFEKLPEGSTLRRCPNISKLCALGFKPRISFDQGLPSVIEWYLANIHLQPKYERVGREQNGK